MTDIRARAIAYARQQPLTPDMRGNMRLMKHVASNEYRDTHGDDKMEDLSMIVDNPEAFRIGMHNMVASAFEMGYAAAVDDRAPNRPLRDPLPSERRAAKRGTRENPLKAKLRK